MTDNIFETERFFGFTSGREYPLDTGKIHLELIDEIFGKDEVSYRQFYFDDKDSMFEKLDNFIIKTTLELIASIPKKDIPKGKESNFEITEEDDKAKKAQDFSSIIRKLILTKEICSDNEGIYLLAKKIHQANLIRQFLIHI